MIDLLLFGIFNVSTALYLFARAESLNDQLSYYIRVIIVSEGYRRDGRFLKMVRVGRAILPVKYGLMFS